MRARAERVLGKLGIGRSADGSIRSHTLRGSVITVLEFGFRQVISLASNMVLAWLLAPEIFGLMALALVIIRGLRLFSDVGLGPSIINHKRGEDPAFLDTAWTVQVIRGVGLWVGACVLAWPAAMAYDEPKLIALIPVIAFTTTIGGFNSMACFTLQRSMSWAPMVVVGLVAQVLSVIAMMITAHFYRSVWAIVVGVYVQNLAYMIGSHLVGGRRPHRFAWDRAAAHDLFKFGRWIFISSLLTFLAGQLDRLLLGRLLTLEELGVYSLAVTVALLPGSVVTQLTAVVLFPALASAARDRPEQLAANVRAAREAILPGGLLATVGVVVGAPILFEYLYDSRYHDASWMAQGLSIAAWLTILQLSADRAVLALGNSKSLAVGNGLKLAVTAAASLIGYTFFDLLGFMVGMALGCLASHALVLSVLWRHGVHLLDQDLKYTGLAVLAGGVGFAIPALVPYAEHTPEHVAVVIATAVLVLVPLGIWSARVLLRVVFRR